MASVIIAFIVESNEYKIMCVSSIVFMRWHLILYTCQIQFEKVAIPNDPEMGIVIFIV